MRGDREYRTYIKGRFIHVSELSTKLFCRLCKAVLSLTDVIKETRKGMHSILQIKYRACDVLNKIPTGKIQPRKAQNRLFRISTQKWHWVMG